MKRHCIIYSFSAVAVATAFGLIAEPAQTQSAGSFVALQGGSPGTAQSGSTNISGTSIAGQFVGGGAGLTGVNANLLDGLDSTVFLQSIPVPLTLTADQPGSHIIRGENSSSTNFSRGVYGRSTAASGQTAGVRGDNSSINGYGVLGFMTATSGTNYGGFFQNQSTGGIGAIGVANAATGVTAGLRGDSWSTDGRGVLGFASASTGSTYGVYAQNNSTSGTAVFGTAIASSGITYGVLGFSSSTSGRGVQGNVSATSGTTYGGWFQSDSSSGIGVNGIVGSASGNTVGVRGESSSTTGYGVFGVATASTNSVTHGVHGRSASNNGNGVSGLASSTQGYGIGVYGESAGDAGYGVKGVATNPSAFCVGVWGESTNGTGVFGIAIGTGQSKAGWFQNHSDNGIGVFGDVVGSGGMTYAVRGAVSNGPGYSLYGVGDAYVTGDLTVTGSKTGYVSDIVINGGDEPLEPGDVVEILGSSDPIIGDIPVMVVQKSQLENSLSVLGPVDCALTVKPIEDDNASTRPANIRYASPQFHIHKSDGPIKPGAYGRVVTLGSFKMIKVDATFGPVRPGDLLVSSSNHGYAMKAKRPAEPGTVIGKSLGRLDKGTGTVAVLVQSR